ncbi:hypothetical protein BV22DRAFT_756443 [Leucogyrophana mollusca]|uniref:Uncharacterized protein n=1 Tax=Leucogyrophana mollusca TaxID=85980 RepID=A0ACB8B700_9AGAM|nr:hypothetical protein BV22DRAFT_756443 [Leucogyrophana mollusca]
MLDGGSRPDASADVAFSSDQEGYRPATRERVHSSATITSGRIAPGTRIIERFCPPDEDEHAEVVIPRRAAQLSFVPLSPPSYHRRRSDIAPSVVPQQVYICNVHNRQACIPCREEETGTPMQFPF